MQIAETLAAEFPQQQEPLADSYLTLGSFLGSSRLQEAESLIRRSIALFESLRQRHDAAAAHGTLGGLLQIAGRLEDAEREFRECTTLYERFLRENPGHPWRRNFQEYLAKNYLLLGNVLNRRNQPQKAMDVYVKAMEIFKPLARDFPEKRSIHDGLKKSLVAYVRLLKSTGQTAEVERFVYEFDPHTPDDYMTRAELHRELGNTDNALTDLNHALAALENHERAASSSIDVAALSNQYARLARTVGVSQYHVELPGPGGNPEKALSIARKAVEVDSTAYLGHLALAEQLVATKHYEEALTEADQAVQLSSREQWWLYQRRARAHFHLAHYDQALGDIAKAIELNPRDESNLSWIPRDLVANCSDKAFRDGILKLADKAVDAADTAEVPERKPDYWSPST